MAVHVPPPIYTVAAAAAQVVLSRGSSSTNGSRAMGGLIALASTALAGSAVAQFRRSETTVNPVEVDRVSALVETGPNAFTRNPMYVGMAGVLVGHAVARQSWLALVPVGIFVAIIDRVQIRDEEAALRAHFGSAYEEYAARVPRWIGPRA